MSIQPHWLPGWRSMFAIVCVFAGLCSSPVASAAAGTSFDHFTTSFELLGQHKDVECAACHVGGIFKGTPHDCASCHTTGSRIGATAKPATHILSGNNCAECHTPSGWKPVAMFNHVGMIGTCSSCHNNVQSIGKPATHIPTTQDCGVCHLPTLPWKTASFDHAGVTGGCATCHNGVQAPGKPATHLPTTEACETCHSRTNFKSWGGTAMNHAGISASCQSCHETGMSWYGVTMVDRPTAAQDPVHPTAAQAPDCASCHSGFAVGDFLNVKLPTNHLPTTAPCVQCHTTPGNYATYTMGSTGHTGITSGCATCHATGKSFLNMAPPALVEPTVGPPAHLPIPTGEDCSTCHSTSSFATGGFGPSTPMNHAGITSGCQACHETGMTWKGVTMVDRPTPTQDPNHPTAASAPDCSTCHSGTAVGDFNKNAKPANHIPTTAACAQCHTAIPNFASYTMGTTGHAGITSGCAACHAAGLSFANMAPPTLVEPPSGPPAHLPIPSGEDCSVCHSTTSFGTGGFGPSTPMSHKGITSGCQACHETGMTWKGVTMVDRPTSAQDPTHPTAAQGADCAACHSTTNFAVGAFNAPTVLPANHIPSSLSCATCHTAIPTWSTYVMGATGHAGITSGCAACHATGKSFLNMAPPTLVEPTVGPPAHLPIPTGEDCSTCHSTSSFATGGFGPSTPMNHAGITSGCQACHETGMTWKGVTMVDRPTPAQDANHPTAAASPDCSTCHSGFNVGDFNKNAKPLGHIPTTATCAQCHTTPSNYGVYTGGATLHTGITSGCATCHGSGTGPWAGVGGLTFTIKQPPSTHLPIPSGEDCSACHSTTSVATGGFASTPMNHAGIKSGCQTCHETAMSWYGVTMVDRPTTAQDPNHPTAAQGADCAACHSTTNFAVGGFNIPTVLPANHIPSSLSCATCHTAIPTWSTYVMGATGHAGITSGCAACHATGKSFLNMAPPALVEPTVGPPAHLPIPNGEDCSTCHSTSSFATGGFGPSTPMNHAGITSGCQSCHETGMAWKGVTMVDRPTSAQDPNHPTAAQGADCAACHSTTNFAVGGFNIPTVLPTNHIPSSLSCATCHTAIPTWSTYVMGATGHAGITSGCATCHATGKSFLNMAPPALVEPTVGPPAHFPIPNGEDCSTCHSTSSFAVGGFGPSTPMKHTGITSGCQSCHETGMAWKGVTMVDRPTSAQDPNHPTAAQGADCAACHSTTNFAVGAFNTPTVLPTNHIPSSLNCATCHTAIPTWSTYVMGATGHTGITSGCAACHATGKSFLNMAPPALVEPPVGPPAHLPIPAADDCSTCHSTSSFATGGFGPSTPMNHANITSGCQTCHETGMAWKGVTMVDRPTPAQDPNHVTAAQTADCSSAGCHSNTNFAVGAFNLVGKPSNHIPTTATCGQCHTTAGNFGVYTGGATLHTGITSGCATCHGTGTGPFAGVSGFSVKQPPSNHIPIGASGANFACEGCHSTTNFTSFAGTAIKHAPVTSEKCMACHEYTMRTANYWYGVALIWHRDSATHHAGQDCSGSSCHRSRDGNTTCTNNCGNAVKPGSVPVSSIKRTPVPTGGSALAANAVAAVVRGPTSAGTTDAGAPFSHAAVSGTACTTCHDGRTALGKGPAHPATSANCVACHATIAWQPVLHVDHAEARGSCQGCHDGRIAAGLPVRHVATRVDCDTCHTTSAWKPAAFDHATVLAGTCVTCHDGTLATAKSASHVQTRVSCDTCHYTLAWTPTRPAPKVVRRDAPPASHAVPGRAPRAIPGPVPLP